MRMNIFMISVAIPPIVIALGLIMALMVWKKKVGYRVFFTTGIIVISTSIVLMVISLIQHITPVFHIPILALGVIYLMIGLVRIQMNWLRIIMVVIGVLVSLLAMFGIFMWGVSGEGALVALSVVFLLIGVALSIGALVWSAKRGRQDGNKK